MMQNLWETTARRAVSAAPLDGNVEADAVIIGGGFTGLSAALHLALDGADVRLVEAHGLGHGGSGRNVGLVNAGLWTPPDDVEAILGAEAGERLNAALADGPTLVFSLIERFEIDCEARRAGTLHVAHAPAGVDDLRNRYRQQVRRGAPVMLLDAAETAARTGSTAFHGALHDARAGTLQPLAYVHGLARAAHDAGAHLHAHTPASGFTRVSDGWRVETSSGHIHAKRLIHATNGYDTGLAGDRAFTPISYLQFATAPVPARLRENLLPGGEGCWDTATVMSSFRFDAAGRLVIGGVGDLTGARLAVHRAWARRKMNAIYPSLAGLDFEFGWCGRIAMTGDHLPRVVSLGESAVSIFGYSGRGIGPGTVFGKCAAEWVRSGSADAFPIAPTPAETDRFAPLKAAYYDLGSLVAHVVGARR